MPDSNNPMLMLTILINLTMTTKHAKHTNPENFDDNYAHDDDDGDVDDGGDSADADHH